MALTSAGTAAVHAMAYPLGEIQDFARCGQFNAASACNGLQRGSCN
ncbi:hypothetical protein PO124_07815 [Bacillus licheniformis]|nr:hypothetical protein [Bacillus licheniformis]